MSEQKKSSEEFCAASYEASKVLFFDKIGGFCTHISRRIQAATTPNELDDIQANLAGEVAKSIKSPFEEFKTTCQLLDVLHPEAKFSYLAQFKHYSMAMFRDKLIDLMSCIDHTRKDLSPNQKSDDSLQIPFEDICKASYETSRQSFSGKLQEFYNNRFERIQNVKTLQDLDAIQAKLAIDIANFLRLPCEEFKTTCQNMDALIPEAERRFLAEPEHFSSVMTRDTVFDLMSCIDHKRQDIARLQTHNQNQVTSEHGLFGSSSKAHVNFENKEPKTPGSK
jgi:predicted HicB family RNase H-like nuclease